MKININFCSIFLSIYNKNLKIKREKKSSTKNLELEILKLQKEKDKHINSLLILKSAFSIIDDMFVKEMENAEIYKKYFLRRWFLCGCGVSHLTTDPRKLSTFVEDVMNPYGRQDKIFEELKQEINKNKTDNSELNIQILNGIKVFNDNSELRYKEMQKETKN